MRRNKQYFYVIKIALFLTFHTFCISGASAQNEKNEVDLVQFEWALVVKLKSNGQDRVVNVLCGIYCECKDSTELPQNISGFSVSDGDKLSVYVKPNNENTHIYLYFEESDGNLRLLFPSSIDTTTLEEIYNPNGTYMPGKYKWYHIDDNKGTEKFHLLAYKNPLTKLKERTLNYDDEKIEENKQKVLNQIKNEKSRIALGKVRKEKTVAFLPQFRASYERAANLDISKLACEIEASHFYSKTIKIKHE